MDNDQEEPWTIYKASQFLPAVLSDPNKGKQSNFFTRTWGDSFVEKGGNDKGSFVSDDITYAHFEQYLRKYGKRLKRHQRCSQLKLEESTKPKVTSELCNTLEKLKLIPDIYMQNEFKLNDPKVRILSV